MRKRYILLAVLACAAIAALTVRLARPAEPIYEGEPLSEWITHCLPYTPRGDTQPAEKALRHAGTNAIPFLLKWIHYEPPAWRRALARTAPQALQDVLRLDQETPGWTLAEKSVVAFAVLGTNAVDAMPGLVQLMRNTNAPQSAQRAMLSLSLLGTNGLPPLISAIEDPHNPFRYRAIAALRYIHTNTALSTTLGPVYLRCVADPTADHLTRAFAANWLRDARYAPDVSVPALYGILTNSGATQDDQAVALAALGSYGALAAGTLPALTNALANPDISYAASNAIWSITTELATNTPTR